jgi:TM2 domain-containing membrane protein YozV/Tfp pilus assembly protein PilE
MGPISPKKRNTVMLLCFFLGWAGVHRFYLGKIITGIIMVVTLGGLGIWTLADFWISAYGPYKDSKGLYIAKSKNTGLSIVLTILITLYPLIFFYFVIVAIGNHQYTKIMHRAMDHALRTAYVKIAVAEEAYYAKHGTYIDDYDALRDEAGLENISVVYYEPITLYNTPNRSHTCFTFVVRHEHDLTIGYTYDSCSIYAPKPASGSPGIEAW